MSDPVWNIRIGTVAGNVRIEIATDEKNTIIHGNPILINCSAKAARELAAHLIVEADRLGPRVDH